MANLHIKVQLSEDRNHSGIMTVMGPFGVLAQYQVLGRGSQGAGDTQMKVKGNTPTGEYDASKIVSTDSWSQNSYGPHGAIRLQPISGNALAAERESSRKGLLIHGGSLGNVDYWRGKNELRATHGCLRLSNDDVKRLLDLIWVEGQNEDKLMCEAVKIKVTVTDHAMSFRRPTRSEGDRRPGL